MINFQTITPLKNFVRSQLKKYPNTKLSTLFKRSRKLVAISLIGDWVLITEINSQLTKIGKSASTQEVTKTLKLSNDPVLAKCRTDSVLVGILTKEGEFRASK